MKHIKKFLALALVVISVFTVVITAMAAYSTMYVDGDVGVGSTVRLRKTPSSSGTILTNIPYGTAVQAEYYNSTWHKVTWTNPSGTTYNGYMMSSYLSTTNPLNAGWIARYGDGVMSSSNGTSSQVRNLQSDLIFLGFSVGPDGADGYYGANTSAGVKAFQQANGLTPDGLAGPVTKTALYNARFGD